MNSVSRHQLEIFWTYRGDEDGFSRVASSVERETMKGVSWPALSDIIQRVRFVGSGKASNAFRTELDELVRALVKDVSVRELAELIAAGRT